MWKGSGGGEVMYSMEKSKGLHKMLRTTSEKGVKSAKRWQQHTICCRAGDETGHWTWRNEGKG